MLNIEEIKSQLAATTKGKWRVMSQKSDYISIDRSGTPVCAMSELNCAETNIANANFIVKSHNEYILALISEVERLTKALKLACEDQAKNVAKENHCENPDITQIAQTWFRFYIDAVYKGIEPEETK
jgi:hypothetical protein